MDEDFQKRKISVDLVFIQQVNVKSKLSKQDVTRMLHNISYNLYISNGQELSLSSLTFSNNSVNTYIQIDLYTRKCSSQHGGANIFYEVHEAFSSPMVLKPQMSSEG